MILSSSLPLHIRLIISILHASCYETKSKDVDTTQYKYVNNTQYQGANNTQYQGVHSTQYKGANNTQYQGVHDDYRNMKLNKYGTTIEGYGKFYSAILTEQRTDVIVRESGVNRVNRVYRLNRVNRVNKVNGVNRVGRVNRVERIYRVNSVIRVNSKNRVNRVNRVNRTGFKFKHKCNQQNFLNYIPAREISSLGDFVLTNKKGTKYIFEIYRNHSKASKAKKYPKFSLLPYKGGPTPLNFTCKQNVENALNPYTKMLATKFTKKANWKTKLKTKKINKMINPINKNLILIDKKLKPINKKPKPISKKNKQSKPIYKNIKPINKKSKSIFKTSNFDYSASTGFNNATVVLGDVSVAIDNEPFILDDHLVAQDNEPVVHSDADILLSDASHSLDASVSIDNALSALSNESIARRVTSVAMSNELSACSNHTVGIDNGQFIRSKTLLTTNKKVLIHKIAYVAVDNAPLVLNNTFLPHSDTSVTKNNAPLIHKIAYVAIDNAPLVLNNAYQPRSDSSVTTDNWSFAHSNASVAIDDQPTSLSDTVVVRGNRRRSRAPREEQIRTFVFVPCSYMGCLKEKSDQTNEFTLLSYSTLTVEKCVYFCRMKKKTYVLLKKGVDCRCLSFIKRSEMTAEKNCQIPCRGNPSQGCGGNYSASVYSVCPVGWYDYTCMKLCHCEKSMPCDFYAGTCPTKGCMVGWQGEKCDIESELTFDPFLVSWLIIGFLFSSFVCICLFSGWASNKSKVIQ